MKTAVQLLQNYLDSIQDPQAAAALFAADGVLELPYLQTLGQIYRVQGPQVRWIIGKGGRNSSS